MTAIATRSPGGAFTKEGIRFYPWQGTHLKSVTSLRKVLGLPYPLAIWMQKKAAERAVNEFPVLDQMMEDGKPTEDIIRWLMKAADEERDSAADRGTAVHDFAAKGIPASDPTVPAEYAPWLHQYELALAREGIKPLLREQQVYSPSMGYAGSFDLIAERKGKVTLIDLKTSKGTYVDHALQLYGYAHADFIGKDDVIDVEATKVLNHVEALGILHVRETEWEYIDVPLSAITKAAWFHLVALADFYVTYPDLASLPTK